MRTTNRLLVLGIVLVLLSGSLVSTNQSSAVELDWQTSIERLVEQQEEDLENFVLRLQEAGEDVLSEKQGELRRAQNQELRSEAKALQAQKEEKLQQLQVELRDEVLRQQLQLMLVNLDAGEQEARFKVIAQLQDQLTATQSEVEEELQEQLQRLEADYEERSQKEMANLRAEVERAMDDELTGFRFELMQELEEKVAELGPRSRSEMANR
ncbi:MAG TPA: hypothetical protein VJZ70_06025 [Limnochordia bacterium]|nr:hypothetical protein [Limnochordia bacterium]